MNEYPEYMEANGNLYKINTDFRVGLACMRAIDDPEINNTERFYAIESMLLGFDVREEDEIVLQDKIATYFCAVPWKTAKPYVIFVMLQSKYHLMNYN